MLATAATMIEKEQLQYTKKKNFIYTFISTSMLVLPQLQHLRHPHSRPSTSYHHSRHEEFHGKQPNFFLYCNILSAVLFTFPCRRREDTPQLHASSRHPTSSCSSAETCHRLQTNLPAFFLPSLHPVELLCYPVPGAAAPSCAGASIAARCEDESPSWYCTTTTSGPQTCTSRQPSAEVLLRARR